MSTELIIAEKPSVAQDIASALGGFTRDKGFFSKPGTIITFARGHLVEIGVPKELDPGFDLSKLPVCPTPFHLYAIKGCSELLHTIGGLANQAQVTKIVNACDAGREGELIFRLIVGYLGIKKPIERMWLQSMTPAGIKAAYANRRTDAQMRPLADAAVCRSEADWLVGVNATRALTKSNLVAEDQLVSAGRVQTPVLTLVVDRETSIVGFKARDYWEVLANLSVPAIAEQPAGRWTAKLQVLAQIQGDEANRYYDKGAASVVMSECQGKPPTSTKDTTAPFKRKPPLPFDLTTLQRTANTKLGFSAAKTLEIAQALYEKHKVTTYPRTDSSYLPEDYPAKVKSILAAVPAHYKQLADDVLTNAWVTDKHAVFNNKKISDHFAIIPNGKAPQGLDDKEQAIYDMVMRRFIATFFPAAEFSKTTRDTVIGKHLFRATGTVLLSPGWLKVYGLTGLGEDDSEKSDKSKEAEVVLPPCPKNQPVSNDKIELKQGKTKPPSRFTEATLLGAMETAGQLIDDDELREAMRDHGLGTPATRAATIEDLLSERKGYLQRKGKQLHPTKKAMDVISALRSCGLELLTSPRLTGDWERTLSQMEKGLVRRADFMTTVRQNTGDLVDKIRAQARR